MATVKLKIQITGEMSTKSLLVTTAVLMTIIQGFLLAGCMQSPQGVEPKPAQGLYEGVEFEMDEVREPQIPGLQVSIADFGAVSGGQELNSEAFSAAIDKVTSQGGGRVTIPPGVWLTGPIVLKSNLELHAEQGALIIFSSDKDLYPLVETSFEGLNTWRCISPIYGKNVENIAFTGKGVWDGSGDAWRFVKKSKLTDSHWKKLVASGGVLNEKMNEWYPSEQFRKAAMNADMNVPSGLKTRDDYEAIRDFLRPVMVSISHSKRILFDGPTFQNSPAWCIHPLIVEDLTVRNITVRNPWYSQNGDGIDIESCKNVVLTNSSFDVGDDAICIKSGKDKDGRDRGIPCENIVIRDCVVYHGHGGVTVGSEMSGGVKNMHVSNCTFIGTDVGLRFKSNRGRGGVVEKIFISGIQMVDIPTQAISFDLYYGGKSVAEMLEEGEQQFSAEGMPVNEETPQFRNIFIRNVTCKGALQGIFLQGLPEMNLENVHLEDIMMEADKGLTCTDASGVVIKDLHLITKEIPAVEFFNSRGVEAENLQLKSTGNNVITVNGSRTKAIVLKGTGLRESVTIGDEVDQREVKF